MRLVRWSRELLIPAFFVVILASLLCNAWAGSLEGVANRGNYPALDPSLYQRVVQNHPATLPDR